MNAKIASLFFVLLCSAASAVPVRFLAWDEDIAARKIEMIAGARGQKIANLHPLKRTGNYGAAGDAPLKLHQDGKSNPDGTPALCEVQLNNYKHPLVLIIPNDKAPAGITAIAIEDDEDNFKWGTYVVFNATKEELVMFVDKAPTKVPVGWKPVQVVPKNIEGPSQVEIRAVKDLKTTLYSMVWQGKSDSRRLVIIAPSGDDRLGPYIPKVIPEDKSALEAERASEGRAANGNGTADATPH